MAETSDGMVEERPSRRVITYLDDVAWCGLLLLEITGLLGQKIAITPTEASHLMVAAHELAQCRDSLREEAHHGRRPGPDRD